MARAGGVLFGVDYYPEQWDRSLWESDARRMREMGIKAVRLMEFAWALLEPEEGRFDFSLFDKAVALLAGRGLSVVLGTPTATFPAWLYRKDPDMVQVHPSGIYRDFGTRRQACFNSISYLDACRRITEAVAQHFGKNPAVIGWQVDNEIGHEGSDRCACRNCRRAWHSWCLERYGDIGELNSAWGTVFWGTVYSDFAEIPVPRQQVSSTQNPALVLDYDRFCSEAAIKFAQVQIEILRRHIDPSQWITTNLYPPPHSQVIDMEQLCKNMDMVSYDNYPVWGDQDEPMPYFFTSYMLSYIRGLSGRGTFAVLEQFSGVQGHSCLGYLPPEKQAVLWTNQAVARGAEAIFYFRWRTAAFGQEQLCYGILDPDGSPNTRFDTLRENIKKNEDLFGLFATAPVRSGACLVYDKDNARLLREQYLSKGLCLNPVPWMQAGYDAEMARQFAPFVLFNVNADVKSAESVDLDRYRIVSLPLYQMADAEFVRRLDLWVKAGGHLVLGWRCGARDRRNRAVDRELPGLFTDMAGVRVKRFESLNKTKVKIRVGVVPAKGEVWADVLEPITARPLAWYRDGRKHYTGAPCVTVNRWGKGRVYYVGTSPDPVALFFLFRRILKKAGMSPRFYGMGIEVVRRTSLDGADLDIVLNHSAKARRAGWRRIEPYGMRILRKSR